MTTLKVDLEEAIKTLKDLKETTPDRIRRARAEMDEARYDLIQQRLTVKWYTWVTRVIEALGPNWRLYGDDSYVEGYVDSAEGEEEVEVGGEVELYRPGETEEDEGYKVYLEGIGQARLDWICPTTENWEELDVGGESATHIASVINEKVAELELAVKAAKAAKVTKETE
jgi:hypothetical protein